MKKELTVETLFNFIISLVIIILVVWGTITIYNKIVATNQYIVHLEKELIEERVKNNNFEDLVDLAIKNAKLEEEIEWFEENLDVIEYLFELEAENEFLKDRLEFYELDVE